VANIVGLGDIGLDDEAIRAAGPHLGQGILGGGLVFIVIDGHFGPALGQLQGDPSTDTA
jgi:hypothetical protein